MTLSTRQAAAQRRLERAAHHEAGHAVAAFSYHKPLHKVSIKADHDAGLLGYVERKSGIGPASEYGETDRYLRLVTENVTILFAGMVAEKEFTKRSHNWWGAQSDIREATFLSLRIMSDDETAPYAKWVMVRTRKLVEWRWPAIHALAQELLVREELSGKDATEFIRLTLFPPRPQLDVKNFKVTSTPHMCIEECHTDAHIEYMDGRRFVLQQGEWRPANRRKT